MRDNAICLNVRISKSQTNNVKKKIIRLNIIPYLKRFLLTSNNVHGGGVVCGNWVIFFFLCQTKFISVTWDCELNAIIDFSVSDVGTRVLLKPKFFLAESNNIV